MNPKSETFVRWSSNCPDLKDDKKFERRDLQILTARHEYEMIGALSYDFYEGDDFKKRILGWCALVGCRDVPDVVSLVFLAEFMMNEIGGLTLPEIEVALKMNMMCELGEDPVEHYQAFNVTYLTKIITRYKKKRLATENKYLESLKEFEKPKAIPFNAKESDYHYLNLVMQDVLEPSPVVAFASTKWMWLIKIGWLEHDQAVFWTAIERAKVAMQQRLMGVMDHSDRADLIRTLKDPKALQAAAEAQAQAMLYREYVESLRPHKDRQEALYTHVAGKHGETVHDIINTLAKGIQYTNLAPLPDDATLRLSGSSEDTVGSSTP